MIDQPPGHTGYATHASRTKRCSRCRQTLPCDAFSQSGQITKRFSSWCRECHREYSRQQAQLLRLEAAKHGRKRRPARRANRDNHQTDTRCYLPTPDQIEAECAKIRSQWEEDGNQLRRFYQPGKLEAEIARRAKAQQNAANAV